MRRLRRAHLLSSSSSSMAAAATPLDERGRCLQARTARRPFSTSIPPLDWICPLLAIDADAFNHGGTPEFAAISAVVRRHNDISNTLSTAPHQFEPIHQRKPNGEVDARPWCLGFHAAMQPRLSAWAPLLDTRNINHGLLRSILRHCVDDHGHPLIESPRKVPKTEEFLRHAHTDIPAVVEAMRQYWMPIRYARAG